MTRLLIVDDEPAVRISLRNFFADVGYEVAEAENGLAALKKLEQSGADIIISDIKMPLLDGLGLLKQARERYPAVEIIIITGHADTDAAIEAVRQRAADFLRKPYELPELYRVVERLRERAELKHELEAKREQLARTRLLLGLNSLAAGMMHEINNPNTYIAGNVELLQRQLLPALLDERVRGIIEEQSALTVAEISAMLAGISEGAGRIADLVTRSASIRVHERGIAGWADVAQAVRETLDGLREGRPDSMPVEIDLPDPAAVALTPEVLRQLLRALLSNALEAVAGWQDGKIVISSEPANDHRIRIVIADNGPGIAVTPCDRVFDPFYTTHNDRPARGLGLFLAYQLAELGGGHIGCRNEAAHGARFWLELPVAAAAGRVP